MSNQLTQALDEMYDPKMAIVVYTSTNSAPYLERRDIIDGKMGAGKPLTKKCVTEIFRAIVEDSEDLSQGYHGVIPKNLLYADTTTGRTRLIWYNPPMKRRMYFVDSLGIPEGEVVMPGIVYEANDNSLKVYCFKGKSPKDPLYQAPFFNVSNHDVCLGTAKTKRPKSLTYIEAMEYWETMFWNSEFSHIYGGNPVKGNLAVITKNCIEKGQPFPMDALLKSKIKLKDILK